MGEPLHSLPGSDIGSEVLGQKVPGNPGHRSVPLEAFLTTEEVAERLNVAVSTVKMRIKEGYLHPIKRRHGKVTMLAFNPDEVENEIARVLAQHQARPGAARRGRPPRTPYSKPSKGQLKKAAQEKKAALAVLPPSPFPQPPQPPQAPLQPRTAFTPVVNPNSYTGADCAKAAKLFREGKQQIDVVIEMGLTFELARYFWDSYLAAQPQWVVPARGLSRLRSLIGWFEDPPTVEGLERALVAHVARQLERAPESSNGETSEPGMELSDEDRAQLAELEREMASSKKPGKKSPPTEAAPVPMAGPKAPTPPAANALPLPTPEPSSGVATPALSALASLTGVDLSKLNVPAEVK